VLGWVEYAFLHRTALYGLASDVFELGFGRSEGVRHHAFLVAQDEVED
jgi:hypothetical protein